MNPYISAFSETPHKSIGDNVGEFDISADTLPNLNSVKTTGLLDDRGYDIAFKEKVESLPVFQYREFISYQTRLRDDKGAFLSELMKVSNKWRKESEQKGQVSWQEEFYQATSSAYEMQGLDQNHAKVVKINFDIGQKDLANLFALMVESGIVKLEKNESRAQIFRTLAQMTTTSGTSEIDGRVLEKKVKLNDTDQLNKIGGLLQNMQEKLRLLKEKVK